MHTHAHTHIQAPHKHLQNVHKWPLAVIKISEEDIHSCYTTNNEVTNPYPSCHNIATYSLIMKAGKD